MRLTFTGTQAGMTYQQALAFLAIIRDPRWTEFGNGLCFGADREALLLAARARPDLKITGFLSDRKLKTAWDCLHLCHEVREAKPPLQRNTDLATWCDEMVATPAEPTEVLRSGTWATIRRGWKLGKPVTILAP